MRRLKPPHRSTRVAILDRDGVINHDRGYVCRVEDFDPIEGSLKAIADLNEAHFYVVVATNQSALARGMMNMDQLHTIHAHLQHLLRSYHAKIHGFYFCPHGPDDHCLCRKPQPGMLQAICERYQIDPAQSFMVGDSIRDLSAARTAGVVPLYVRTGSNEYHLQEGHHLPESSGFASVPVFTDLKQASAYMIQNLHA